MENLIEKTKSDFMDSILGKKFNFLDDGFVRAVDYMGNDSSIVQAARVSCDKGTKKALEDEDLIRYLMRHKHGTPFEMCEIKLHIRVPMDCWRQWVRHRTASINERSSRYSIIDDGALTTSPKEWRMQAKTNKQGSGDFFLEDIGEYFTVQEKEIHEKCMEIYKDRVEKGMAREQARKDLPLCSYTEAYWKIDIRNLLNFLELRMDSHAQFEIRQYANTIGEKIISKWIPVVWSAFNDYCLNSITFSAKDIELLNLPSYKRFEKAIEFGWIPNNLQKCPKNGDNKKIPFNLERFEFETKAKKIGIEDPFDLKYFSVKEI
jgi:thymidylate synthase (FAD)